MIDIPNNKLCDNGCGSPAKFFSQGTGRFRCSKSANSCPANRLKNSLGLKQAYIEGRKDNKHWDGKRGWAKNLTSYEDNRIKSASGSNLFEYGRKGPHKKILIKERGYRCEACLTDKWLGNPIPLELDHIDGDNKNNIKSNLRLLCPNCHYFTPTYRGRKNNGRAKYSEEYLISEIPKHDNITALLKKLDMSDSSNNHARIKRIMLKFNLTFNNK